MNKVFIANKSPHDFSGALKYGELVFVTEGKLNRFNANDMLRASMDVLKDSSPDDHIVLCSLNVLNSVLCSAFAVKHKRLNLLLFNKGEYIERNLVFEDD